MRFINFFMGNAIGWVFIFLILADIAIFSILAYLCIRDRWFGNGK